MASASKPIVTVVNGALWETEPPRLSKAMLQVLRWVWAGDPYRDRSGGQRGKNAREHSLKHLEARQLLRKNKEGLWRVTALGKRVLGAAAYK